MRKLIVVSLAFFALACDKEIKEVRIDPAPALQPPAVVIANSATEYPPAPHAITGR